MHIHAYIYIYMCVFALTQKSSMETKLLHSVLKTSKFRRRLEFRVKNVFKCKLDIIFQFFQTYQLYTNICIYVYIQLYLYMYIYIVCFEGLFQQTVFRPEGGLHCFPLCPWSIAEKNVRWQRKKESQRLLFKELEMKGSQLQAREMGKVRYLQGFSFSTLFHLQYRLHIYEKTIIIR